MGPRKRGANNQASLAEIYSRSATNKKKKPIDMMRGNIIWENALDVCRMARLSHKLWLTRYARTPASTSGITAGILSSMILSRQAGSVSANPSIKGLQREP